jgi:hypothetical protein
MKDNVISERASSVVSDADGNKKARKATPKGYIFY